jgi:hypothetical protein
MANKKAQNEIVGFVMIVVIVIIIGVIFFSLSIGRGGTSRQTSAELAHFLSATMQYTTNCSTSYLPVYENIGGLTKACFDEEVCIDGKNPCKELNQTLDKIIRESLGVSEQASKKAYHLNIYYNDSAGIEPIINMSQGNFEKCASQPGALESLDKKPGAINLELEICVSE